MSRTVLFLSGYTAAGGTGLYASDGTAAGTALLSGTGPGTSGVGLRLFAPVTSGVVFQARDGSPGVEGLFVSDGTSGGTVELKNDFLSIYSFGTRFYSYLPTLGGITAFTGGRVLFTGSTSAGARTLFVTDGTIAGTVGLADFGPTNAVGVSGITSLGTGVAVFDVTSGTLPGLWATDGTAAGTVRIAATTPAIAAVFAGRALTTLPDGGTGVLLGVTDGTAGGTAVLRDFTSSGTNTVSLSSFGAVGSGRELFTVNTGGGAGVQLWATDGTAAGTVLLAGRAADAVSAAGLNPQPGAALSSGVVLFSANNGTVASSTTALWRTDGTAAGTVLLTDLEPASNAFAGIRPLGNGRAVVTVTNYSGSFTGSTVPSTVSLYGTDGTAAGTVKLFTLVSPAFDLGVTVAALPDGRAILAATAAGNVLHLYTTDGTAAGTAEFTQLQQSTSFGSPGLFVLPDGRVVFNLTDPAGGTTLWATGGTAATTAMIGTATIVNGTPLVATVADVNPLFDSNYYVGRYPDVRVSNFGAEQHYALSGFHEGRDPDPLFSTAGYLGYYKDVGAAGINPLTHYDQSGWHEGRDPSAAFDTGLYLLFNPDVKAAGVDPLAHWLVHGQAEGRKMSAAVDSGRVRDLFDPTFYGLGNADVTAAGLDLRAHFDTAGVKEGRDPDAFFDVKGYLARNPDVAASGINPVAHYLNVGWKEGRDPSTHFSTNKYLAAYSDVKAVGVNPLQHFLTSGIIEGRSGFGDRI